jgi:hypothetical protein
MSADSRKRRKILTALSEAQNHRCAYCGCETWLYKDKENSHIRHACNTKRDFNLRQATVEHITPQSLGGSDKMENLVMACVGCNSIRSSMDAFYFYSLRGFYPNGTRISPGEKIVYTKFHQHFILEKENIRAIKKEQRRHKFLRDLLLLMVLVPDFLNSLLLAKEEVYEVYNVT